MSGAGPDQGGAEEGGATHLAATNPAAPADRQPVSGAAVLNQLSEGVIVTDAEGRITFVNEAAERLHGVKSLAVGPDQYSETYHLFTEEGEPYPAEELPLARAALRGETVTDARWRIRRPDGTEVVAIGSARPLNGGEGKGGAVLTLRDDTARQEVERALRASEAALRETTRRLDAVLNNTRMAVFLMDERQHCVYANTAAEELTGYRFAEMRGRPLHDVIHNKYPDGRHYPLEECPIDRAFPEDYQVEGEELFVHRDGSFYPVAFTASPIRDQASKTIGTIIEVRGIAEEKARQAALAEETRALEAMNRIGAELAGELDVERVVQMVTDAGVALSGAQFGAFFYNVMGESGVSYMLYTLSGADRGDFDGFPMPRATGVFHPTFAGEGAVRSDDITQDPRYGQSAPHFGLPDGHLPVRSYLAVSVTARSGTVIGGLFFGHAEAGRFNERHEHLLTGIAGQAAVAIDNARLFEAAQRELAERRRAEQALRELNQSLEARVADAIAEREQAEEALRQAQKMETLGHLTGGVAHDFNNLLQIVSGNLEILQRNLPPDSPRLRRAADNAARGADRAAILTQRLLAFSRRQPLAPKPIDLNQLVGSMSELLHRTLGEMIEIETVLASGLWPVEADPNQLENAIINLAVNARDAMESGGKLTIETANSRIDTVYGSQNGVAPGQYVAICVSDTGGGMDANTVARAFEPFFTTKEVGRGTGLGLSMVYGFVKQSGGHVKIYSEVGEGTSVKIYLPRLHGGLVEQADMAAADVPEGTREETVLVCEDDDDVRAYSVEVLRELGYRVLEAHDGPSALRLVERQEGRVDLLFTDVVLPSGMTGAELARRARVLRPELKVLFTTGYARNAIVHHGRLDPGVELITKPFAYSDLAARVRDLLDKPDD